MAPECTNNLAVLGRQNRLVSMAADPHRNYRPYLKVYVIWYPGLDRASITGKANSGKLLAERLSPFSDRFVADSKYRDVIPTRDQTPVIVQLAALGDDRKLVFYVRWRDSFPSAQTSSKDAFEGGFRREQIRTRLPTSIRLKVDQLQVLLTFGHKPRGT